MATCMATRSVSGAAASRAARPAARTAVVVRASAVDRRAALGTFAAGVVLSISTAAQAFSPVDLIDDRKVKATGFDDIYEARNGDLPQDVRAGFRQARQNLDETKKRVKESEARIDSALLPSIEKSYWTEAREELRRQVGTLRFDLNALASAKGDKAATKAALALKKEFFAQVEALDLALVKKNQQTALKKLDTTKSTLDAVLAAVL